MTWRTTTKSLARQVIKAIGALLVPAAWPHVTNMGYECGPGACGPAYGRRYLSKAERAEMLRDYQKELEGELQGVKERLQELQA